MSGADTWIERLYLKDTLEFLSNQFTRLLPRINARISDNKPSSVGGAATVERDTILGDRGGGGWSGFLKTWFVLVGASVFVVSSPLLCAYLWNHIRASRLFAKKENELADCGVVITGCDSGIGIETAAVLSEDYPSMLVFAGCLTIAGVQNLNALRRQNLIPVKMDVTSDQEIRQFVNAVRARLAHRRLYAIVNNAGVFDGSLFEVTPIEVYKKVMEVNFFGVVRVTKAFLPFLARGDGKGSEGGRIINISSVAALLSSPANTVYCSSKYALTAFTDGLRQELRELGIKVIQVVPGPVRTGSLNQIPVAAHALLSAGSRDVLQRCGGPAFLTANSRFFTELYNSAAPPITIARIIQKALIRRHPKDAYYDGDGVYNLLGVCPHFVRDFLLDPTSFRKQILAKYKQN